MMSTRVDSYGSAGNVESSELHLDLEATVDRHIEVIDLTREVYRDERGEPWVFPVVRRVEKQMAGDTSSNHEYLPMGGLPEFNNEAAILLLGENSVALKENRALCVQAASGVGALRLAADFCKRELHMDRVYVPLHPPTQSDHLCVFESAGFSTIKGYRYWDKTHRRMDINGLSEDLSNAPERSVVIFQACTHNPAWTDSSMDHWKQIVQICQKKRLFVVVDCAYLGCVSGDPNKDAVVVRMFVDLGLEFFAALSFSNNFGLYNERVGSLLVVTNDSSTVDNLSWHIGVEGRDMASYHGARVVSTILGDPVLYEEWRENLQTVVDRVRQMRRRLYEYLVSLHTPGRWDHVVQQTGLFCYTGLKPHQVKYLKGTYHIHLSKEGRICVAGLNDTNVDYVSNAIHDVVLKVTDDAKL